MIVGADSRARLVEALVRSLQLHERAPKAALTDLQAEYLNEDARPHYGLAGAVLALPEPALGRDLLSGMLADENPLVAIEAAAALAVLGDGAGAEVLLGAQVCTNSCIEFFYARAGLVLLGEPIPAPLARSRSVFRHLEQLLESS